MTKQVPDTMAKLEAFDRNASPAGLFWRYCRGRVQYFWARMAILVGAGLAISFLLSPIFGLVTFLIAAMADIADTAVLKHAMSKKAHSELFLKFRKPAVIFAAFQSGAIAFTIVIAWLYGGPPAHFFSLVMITSAAIDAGLGVYYYRFITRLKQTMFIVAMLTLFGVDYFLNLTPHAILIVDFGAASILAYVISRLLQYLYNFQRYNKSAMRRVIVGEQNTRRANIDLKIQRSEAQKLALVAEKVNDAIIISTPDGKITWVNATFTAMTGYSFEEAVGQRAGALLDAPWTSKSAKGKIAGVAKTQRPIRVEIENRTKSNDHIWIESSITPIFDEDGKHVLNIGVERDISIAKKTEMDLMQAKRAAEKALQVKTEFLATMSHEIRTPMNGIVGMSDLLSRTSLSDDQSQYVSVITESGAALLAIIDDILYFSKLEANKLALSIAPFSPKELLNAIFNLLEPTAAQKGLNLALQISNDIPSMLMGDKGRIRQIIVNLVGNAIKFTNEGHVTMAASATPTPTGILLTVKVADSGIGIPSGKLADVFDAFTQIDSKSTRSAGGTGLGLSISAQLAHEMKGDITVESSDGNGSCFTFTAPLPKAAPRNTGPSERQTSQLRLPQSLNILVAEDNITNQFIIGKMLGLQGANLCFAENGRVVLGMFKENGADVILMDISMPVVDGLEATRSIREYEKANGLIQTPIIALTANAFESDKKNCFDAGMNGFVAKPIILEALLKEIGMALKAENNRVSG